MRRLMTVLAVLVLSTSLLLAQEPATWTIDNTHSFVGFSVRHLMVSNVRGNFDKFSGSIVGDPKNPAGAKVDVTIDATTLNTNNSNRDEHLRSADFFETAKYPTITFQSKRVESVRDGKLRVVGNLTMHGVTREVVLDVDGPSPEVQVRNGSRIGVSASTKLSRKDFGLNWNRVMEAGGVTVGDDVTITIELELVKKAPEAPKATTS